MGQKGQETIRNRHPPSPARLASAVAAGGLLLTGTGLAVAGWLTRSSAPVTPAVRIAGQAASRAASASPRAGGAATWHFPKAQAPGPNAAGATAAGFADAPPMSFSVPVRVSVPAIGVTASVLSLGENADGTAAVPPLSTPQLTSWFDAGPAPGQAGRPAAIFGHLDTTAGPAVRLRASRSVAPDSTSEYTAAMNHPGGSHASQALICRRTDATGSCRPSVEVRAAIATGTGSPVSVPAAAGAGVTIRVPPRSPWSAPHRQPWRAARKQS
jgi:hypothetical protein